MWLSKPIEDKDADQRQVFSSTQFFMGLKYVLWLNKPYETLHGGYHWINKPYLIYID